MFNHRTARIGILFAVLILALGAVGIGSALWSETITIEGDVATGNVDVDFTGAVAYPTGPFGYCDVVPGEDALLVTMMEVFPGFECILEFEVANAGTIPIMVYEPVFAMPPEVEIDGMACYPNPVLMEPGMGEYCGVALVVTPAAAQSSMYSFYGEIYAEQVTP